MNKKNLSSVVLSSIFAMSLAVNAVAAPKKSVKSKKNVDVNSIELSNLEYGSVFRFKDNIKLEHEKKFNSLFIQDGKFISRSDVKIVLNSSFCWLTFTGQEEIVDGTSTVFFMKPKARENEQIQINMITSSDQLESYAKGSKLKVGDKVASKDTYFSLLDGNGNTFATIGCAMSAKSKGDNKQLKITVKDLRKTFGKYLDYIPGEKLEIKNIEVPSQANEVEVSTQEDLPAGSSSSSALDAGVAEQGASAEAQDSSTAVDDAGTSDAAVEDAGNSSTDSDAGVSSSEDAGASVSDAEASDASSSDN